MRQILFRGKDTKGVWHIGLLAHIGNAWYISNKAGVATAFEVIPETIGQYTGLNDKNGTKIFEGDIIETDNGRISAISVVQYGKFEPKMFYDLLERFVRPRPKEKLYGLFAKSTNGEQMLISECSHLIEIIGNIHDNRELLKGGENNAR